MIRLPNILAIRVVPTEATSSPLIVKCLGGRAKWHPESQLLSIRADLVDDETHDAWIAFLGSNPASFDMEITCDPEGSANSAIAYFKNCTKSVLDLKSSNIRPRGPNTTRYYFKATAELKN